MIKLIVEVGDKVIEYQFPMDAAISVGKPIEGWMEIRADGKKNWFRLERVIAMMPVD